MRAHGNPTSIFASAMPLCHVEEIDPLLAYLFVNLSRLCCILKTRRWSLCSNKQLLESKVMTASRHPSA